MCCLLRVVRCVLFEASRELLADGCLLLVARVVVCCCEFVVAHCSLFVVCWWLLVSFGVLWLWYVVVCNVLVRIWLLFVVWCVALAVGGRRSSLSVVVRC